MNFKGKTAIATGAASGMALLFLQKMAAAGANVVLTDVNQDAVWAERGADIAKTDNSSRKDFIMAAL